ncbi:MAG: DnaJ domain-containing protein [Benjaminiella poitrasii]|nr:MAG: DnaJ domain-containing protein [Benjaminiella poitrasii]
MQSIFDLKKEEEEDLYSILNCVDTSSPEQIKTEYKRLALIHHPDKATSNSKKEFEKIKAAYDILSDPAKRALYERWKSSKLIIPFSDFIQLGTHAQTVHWQSLPTQMTLADNDTTIADNDDNLKAVRLPSTAQQLPKVPIQTSGFWKSKEYNIQERLN